jgi:outer membrane protein assembly factor BamB
MRDFAAFTASLLLAAVAYAPRAMAADQQAQAPQPVGVLDVLKKALEPEEERRRRAEAERRRAEIEAARRLFEAQRAAAIRGAFIRGAVVPPYDPTGIADVDPGDLLKTDAELDRLLKRADEFVQQQRYDLAVVLWQEVLDKSSDTVMTRDDWLHKTADHEYRTYRPVSVEVEATLARLPAAGLRVYRATADGEAKAILAASEGDGNEHETGGRLPDAPADAAPSDERERALAEVVRRFFFSTCGDDAAFELACLKMEHREFVGAGRLLNKVLREYSDPSVPRGQVLLRLAVANARSGDHETARELLAELDESAGAGLRHAPLVRRDVEETHAETVAESDSPGAWHMRLGNPSRTGHMKAIAFQTGQPPPTELWSQELGVELTESSAAQATSIGRGPLDPFAVAPQVVHIVGGRAIVVQPGIELRGVVVIDGAFGEVRNVRTPTVAAPTPGSMIERWKQAGWNPAGAVLLDQGRVYFKGPDRLLCCDAATGETIWAGRPNRYPLDPLSQLYASMFSARVRSRLLSERPASPSEIALFGDQVRQSMSIAGNLVLNVEGDLMEGETASEADAPGSARERSGTIASYGAPTGWLSAYDAASGKLKWRRSADDRQADSPAGVAFLAAPVPCADLLVAPVRDNGQLWLCGMSAEDGRTVWKTFLCEEPPDARTRWSPVGIAVEGGDAYVATGAGTVFAIDALSGALSWVVTYPRARQGSSALIRAGYGAVRLPAGPIGFCEDVVIPSGRQLVVMASDCDYLVAFDRRTGELLWESPADPSGEGATSRYCLGVMGDGLYVAGKNKVRRYDVPSGRLVWETQIEDSFGRGALTETALYVPLEDSVLQLDLETGAERGRIPLVLLNDEPVGNLYSNGERLLVVGMGRVYALGEPASCLAALAKLIEKGSGRAQLRRMRLRARLGSMDDAVADLRAGYDLLLEGEGPASANAAIYEAISDLELDTARPRVSLELLAKSVAALPTDWPAFQPHQTEGTSKRSTVFYRTLKSVQREKIKGVASLVLGVAPLCTEGHLLTAARQAMATTVAGNDEELLRRSLTAADANVRAVTLAGLTVLLRERPPSELKEMLTSDDDYVRLAAAIGLANQGDRAALPALGDLLTSGELEVQSRSACALRALTGRAFGFSPHDPIDRRAKAAAKWRAWIESEVDTAELSFPLDETNVMRGRTLITSHLMGRVVEIDSQGNETWQMELPGAWKCQALPDGHRLVCSCTHPTVAEYDVWGDEVWRATLAGQPFSVERLDNGNTLVACYDGRIQEIRPDRTVAWEVTLGPYPVDADRLENGNTLICLKSANAVVEIDGSGRVVWELPDVANLRSAQRLPNGNTLVCHAGSDGVFEVDRERKVVWRASELRDPRDAQRLPNGHTLVADSRGLREIDPAGSVTWEWREADVTRFSRFVPEGQ